MFRRRRKQSDFSAEINAHIQLESERLQEQGLGDEEARMAARRAFGNVTQAKERFYEAGRWLAWDHLWQDVRYGLRMLAKNRGFAAVAVMTLALGIGATTAIFSVVNAVLLRPLPYQDADRLVVVLHYGNGPVSAANFIDWRSQNHVFERMGAAEYWTPNLTGVDKPERVWALHITSDILPLLGVQPLLGRMFLPKEDQRGREHEVILSFRAWQRRFGGEPGIIGRSAALDGERYRIIGVMPPQFAFAPFWATKAELWAPLSLTSRTMERGGNSLRVLRGSSQASPWSKRARKWPRLRPGLNRSIRARIAITLFCH